MGCVNLNRWESALRDFYGPHLTILMINGDGEFALYQLVLAVCFGMACAQLKKIQRAAFLCSRTQRERLKSLRSLYVSRYLVGFCHIRKKVMQFTCQSLRSERFAPFYQCRVCKCGVARA